MDFAAAHVGFVVAAYGASVIGLAGLAVFILLRDLKLKRRLATLDGRKRGS
jgi:heme exporter protein CcmD